MNNHISRMNYRFRELKRTRPRYRVRSLESLINQPTNQKQGHCHHHPPQQPPEINVKWEAQRQEVRGKRRGTWTGAAGCWLGRAPSGAAGHVCGPQSWAGDTVSIWSHRSFLAESGLIRPELSWIVSVPFPLPLGCLFPLSWFPSAGLASWWTSQREKGLLRFFSFQSAQWIPNKRFLVFLFSFTEIL